MEFHHVFRKSTSLKFFSTINSISMFSHCTFQSIVFAICLISILGYSPTALSAGSSKEERKLEYPIYQDKPIPGNIRREGREKLLNPGKVIAFKPDDQKVLITSVVPKYATPGVDPYSPEIRLLTREPDRPNLPPIKKKEEEDSHHAHHQNHPCDEGNGKQECLKYTPLEKALIENKLLEK